MANDETIPRCWADSPSCLTTERPIECQALGTDLLGLCPRHAALVGEDELEPAGGRQ